MARRRTTGGIPMLPILAMAGVGYYLYSRANGTPTVATTLGAYLGKYLSGPKPMPNRNGLANSPMNTAMSLFHG